MLFDLQEFGDAIVQELSALIDTHVIITDRNGFIIASTDPLRLNTFHEGATLSMKNQTELHMTKEMCERLTGVRPGIVMPIIIGSTPIGVIGITGKPEEVGKYAKLVRKVAELFITDSIARQERERHTREIEFFIFDLVTGASSPEAMMERAKLINLDTSLYRRIALIRTDQQMEIADVERLEKVQIIHPELKIFRWGLEKMGLLLPDMPRDTLSDGLIDLSRKLGKRSKRSLPVGIGEVVEFTELRKSFEQAEIALDVSVKQGRIVFEGELKLELLYAAIPADVQAEFLRRTIEPLFEQEELLHNLEVWLTSGKSLKEVADDLHIHKNTLSYRLNKVEQLLDVRLNDNRDLALLYTAIRLAKRKQSG